MAWLSFADESSAENIDAYYRITFYTTEQPIAFAKKLERTYVRPTYCREIYAAQVESGDPFYNLWFGTDNTSNLICPDID